MNFGEKVRFSREKLKLTQDEAAEKIRKLYIVRISGAYLSMIERSERTNLTSKLKNALIDFFKIDDEIKEQPKKPKDLIKILEQEEFTLNGQMATQEDRDRLLKMVEAMYWDAKSKNKRK